MTAAPPRVFSIPPHENFLPCLADALLAGKLIENFPEPDDPFGLARATVFLPTRRACRELAAHFKARKVVLLPRLRPLGDESDEDFLPVPEEDSAGLPSLPPTISPLERQIVLSRLVLEWMKTVQQSGDAVMTPASPADAVHLANALAQLLDMTINEGLPFSALQDLPPLDLQQHWQSAFRFLQIASEAWPHYLKEKGLIEPTERRRLVMRVTAQIFDQQPDMPVIAAGSTGSVPVTAEFLVAIARHKSGALILPGLDRKLDDESWKLIDGAEPIASHPQAALASLLTRLRITRDQVVMLGTPEAPPREALLSEAMRPAETSERWEQAQFCSGELSKAVAKIGLVEAAHEHEEALAIACLMREALEDETATTALVTPDRLLARRVAVELKRFGIEADDSAGTPLSETPIGLFARLIADVAASKCDGLDCLSLLKHPLCRLGQSEEEAASANSAIERLCFRGIALAGGTQSLIERLAQKPNKESARFVGDEQRQKAAERVERFCAAMRPFENLLNGQEAQPLGGLLSCHLDALLALARPEAGSSEASLQENETGGMSLEFMALLRDTADSLLEMKGEDYPSVFFSFAASVPVRAQQAQGRAFIYGLLEARLLRHNRIILGSLNEGMWPRSGHLDPWLSRGMRAALKLPVPERRVGLSAHDFVQALGTEDAWLTRSLKIRGAPSVPSRFVQRLSAVAGERALAQMRVRGEGMLSIARSLLHVAAADVQPAGRPKPVPPVAARPRRLSVTQVEKLLRDPYSIYAEHILQLKPFEPICEDFGARHRGTLLHLILSEFVQAVDNGATADLAALTRIAQHHFAPFLDVLEVKAYWWPEFLKLAPALISFEQERRSSAQKIAAEAQGKISLGLPAGEFTLSARADRIEKKRNGAFAIIDFKTGPLPRAKDISAFFALQLHLQAAILRRGGFQSLKGETDEAFYLSLADEDLEQRPKAPSSFAMELAEKSLAKLERALSRYDGGAAYVSKADSPYAAAYNDYAHLARVGEWGLAGAESQAA